MIGVLIEWYCTRAAIWPSVLRQLFENPNNPIPCVSAMALKKIPLRVSLLLLLYLFPLSFPAVRSGHNNLPHEINSSSAAFANYPKSVPCQRKR